MSNGTHPRSWDTLGTRKSVLSQCPDTPCPMCLMSPIDKPAGNVAGKSTRGGAHWKNAYRFLTMVTHRTHGTRLLTQALSGNPHGTRPWAPWDTAGPSYRVRVGGTRSRDIPVSKVKLERVACQNSIQIKDYFPCR